MESKTNVGKTNGNGFRNLLVYQRIKELIILIYKLTEKLPKNEEFGLKSQLRRAAVSILANFSEGYLRRSNRDKLHFLEMAETSHHEIEAEADICRELSYLNDSDYASFEQKSNEVGYLMHRYASKIPSS